MRHMGDGAGVSQGAPRWTGRLFCVAMGVSCGSAVAGSHLWRINEVFSDAGGTVQFIELEECCGAANETALAGKWVRSESTGSELTFPENLPPDSTANQHLLLGTAAFAALAGAPTPDYLIPENFVSLASDELTYWFYTAATMTFGAGALPLDGVLSLNADGSTGVNSPTNFADVTGSVDANAGGVVQVPTGSSWSVIGMALTVLISGAVTTGRGLARGRACHSCM